MTKKILVTGATGQQGGLVARNLLNKGHEVRAFVRDLESAASKELMSLGATLAQGDFDNI
ncbi:NAD(P)H-binding protein [Candidatus Lucifugimonas marina]|uniref:NAD(P)H-binding protein n=1 Tax=Candidatus Lucifugimonas marina TaxID=3038979 RepID=A0AAJ5ZFV4_9CHLR|nr:NAD(P)H-binding protein [SAR202 cluster bacterium JH702]MDG0869463.1 NAD(P)H-binding protein [SAR202 cluster bacterium JH639]WFG34203.1 NAD(P)H-binding protein [SAR202 cluster bacterium JH545]WFG38132.1 NAD(P)H-binding protein [SAR202 cluster bacterium JH1073]